MTTDDALLRTIMENEALVAEAERNIKQAKDELLNRRKEEIFSLLSMKEDHFGDVSIVVGNHKVKVNVPKKVVWNQDALAAKHQEIVKVGDDPSVYMEVKYNISESAYKRFPEYVRDFFQDARTVSAGNPSIKIVEEKA